MRYLIYVTFSAAASVLTSWFLYLAKYGRPETSREALLYLPSVADLSLTFGFLALFIFVVFDYYYFRQGENE
jgi:hypothetical protein